MNHEKAREYFSAYYEDTLEVGIRNSVERRLQTDAQLQAEYRAFSETMDQLSSLNLEEIEVPSYLSDRIATRIEQAKGPVSRTSWLSAWLPRLALGGLAAAALFGAVVSLSGPSGSKAFEGNPLEWLSRTVSSKPAASVIEGLVLTPTTVKAGDQSVPAIEASLRSSTPKTVVFSDEMGKLLETVDVKQGQTLRSPISNVTDTPSLTQIRVTEESTPTWVALPGTVKVEKKAGSGTIKEYVMALAATYRQPIVLRANNTDKMVAWTFKAVDPKSAAIETLDTLGYKVSITGSNVLTIAEH